MTVIPGGNSSLAKPRARQCSSAGSTGGVYRGVVDDELRTGMHTLVEAMRFKIATGEAVRRSARDECASPASFWPAVDAARAVVRELPPGDLLARSAAVFEGQLLARLLETAAEAAEGGV